MPASRISLDKAKPNKLFYVVANVMVYRDSDQRCLILKRDERETAHPGKWACTGGKLEWKDLDIKHPTRLNGDVLDYEDALEKLCQRETLEEAGVEIEGPLRFIDTNVFVRPDEVPVVLIKFAARYKSGEVRPEPGGFTDFAWVNADEARNYPCIMGIPEEVATTIKLFAK
jgi:ADP-ribose pyrophosphatase YjhB (NUDIX family)